MSDGHKFNDNDLPNEIQIGRLRIAGQKTASILYALESFLKVKDRPDFSLITNAVQIYLDQTALKLESFESSGDSTLILNLEADELLSITSKEKRPIRYFCQSDPRDYIGPMLDRYRGTYFRQKSRELIYSSDSDTEIYSVAQSTELTWQLVAAICVLREGGIPESRVRAVLENPPGISPRPNL